MFIKPVQQSLTTHETNSVLFEFGAARLHLDAARV